MNNDNLLRFQTAHIFATLMLLGVALLFVGCSSTSESTSSNYTIEPGPAVPEGVTVYAEDEVDQAPELVDRSAFYNSISYPREAVRDGVQGTVRVAFVIGPDGDVYEPEVVESVAPSLDYEAVQALRATKWHPGTLEDTAVFAKMEKPVGFFVN